MEKTLLIGILLLIYSCTQKADLIFYNAEIYTVDSQFSKASSFAVKNGKFIAIGTDKEVLDKFDAPLKIDAKKQIIYPGFIDAHCHYYGYAKGLSQINLVGTKSFDEIIKEIEKYIDKYPKRKWIIGRGWDQNDWENKTLPTNELLNTKFPQHCIVLKRVDGHALLANDAAISNSGSKIFDDIGGSIVYKEGKNTGLYIDNAMELIESSIPELLPHEINEQLLMAQKNCLQVGLTSLCDAGLEYSDIQTIQKLQKQNTLKLRFNIMVSYSPNNLETMIKKGKIKEDRLEVNSFKLYADGALGSRGACLISDYEDRKHHRGFLLKTPEALESVIASMASHKFQINTHCIGDSANRILLKLYAKYLNKKDDQRWRIEHAQIVNPEDYHLFADFNIIPSVQPTHATSDMYWANERLGHQRVKYAYAYKNLLSTAGILASGTDFPVEDINPMFTFCAAVFRKDKNNFPLDGFQMENALPRIETLKSMTIWAAFAQFEEHEKGSIEIGKCADFVLMNTNLITDSFEKIMTSKINATFIAGEKVYE